MPATGITEKGVLLSQPKIHPDLAITTLRTRRSRQYRLWTLARALNSDGSGNISLAELQAAASERGYKGFSPGSLRRLVREGEGLFWQSYHHHGQRYLRLRGLAHVCQALGIHKLRHAPVYLATRHLKTMKAFRAACHISQFNEEFSAPISRRVLTRIEGRSGDTQRRYEKAMGALVATQNNATPRRDWNNGDDVPQGHFVALVGDETCLLQRLPNSYSQRLRTAPRGMMRRVNSRIGGYSLEFCAREARSRRLFYADSRAAQRRAQGLDEGDTFYLRGDKWARGGVALWSQWTIANQHLFCSR